MADPLSVAGTAVGIVSLGIQVTQSVHDYYVSFKSQPSDTSQLLQKLKDLQALLGQLLSHLLTDRKARPGDDVVLQRIRSNLEKLDAGILKLKFEAEKFHLQTPAEGFQAAIKTTARRLAYPFKIATLQGLEKEIENLKSHVSLALSLLQQKTVDRLEDDVENVKAVLDTVRSSQISSEIRDWLDAPDASVDFQEACRKKYPGTGLWLVNDSTFRGWLEHPSSFLWLRGFAGSGKSVLCSTAIQYTSRHHVGTLKAGSRVGIAFFFFAFSDDSKQSASSMLRALVMQLADQLQTTPPVLQHLYEKHRRGSPPDLGLLDCLRQIVRAFGEVYIFLDALDESPQDTYRDSVMETIADIRGWSEPCLHLLVTSRGAVDIRDGLQAAPSEIVNMSNGDVGKDIAVFVTQFLQRNPRLQKWKSCHSQIEETLINKADGV
ncbi:vegetative incompatibility protein HET-E-1 [Colletotrichum musicola]|uniref:Vegetative incompatibility protein HET-E-1 n=1 Tax=Colletotrichum musicola TaxID=2175873 RepID=A0A8H6N982_9PEZI|nr:vegetative incompatibility protein HET-E-1 [Colletotrichum musicola]